MRTMGHFMGTGAAVTILFGIVPDEVVVENLTDGDILTTWRRGKYVAFTSGGTNEVKANTQLIGNTSATNIVVREVILVSGAWSSGTAAGWFVVDDDDINGTLTSENMTITAYQPFGSTTVGTGNDCTVVAPVEFSSKVTTAEFSATGNDAITSYSADDGKGFTIGSGVAETGKLIRWTVISD